MRNTLIALLAVMLLQAQSASAQAPTGDAQRGRGLFSGGNGGALCMLCHGRNAEGGYAPDLADVG